MNRTDPPPLATWMLEHLTPPERDEALAGDLLEDFCRGRSNGWYWRQALSACVVGWVNHLRQRRILLVFAILWSLMAPAWKTLSDRIQDSPIFTGIWPMFGPIWALPAFALWLVINSTFLFAGILVYVLSNTSFGKTIPRKNIGRAFLWAPLIFTPIYAATFVLVNLYWYSFFANTRLAITPFAQVSDLRLLADVMRVPYFIALLCALWRVIPPSMRTSQSLFAASTPIQPLTQTDTIALSSLAPFPAPRFLGFMVAAGLINAMLAAVLLCRLPQSHAPTFTSLLIRAISYVVAGTLAGVGGAWVYWKSPWSPWSSGSPFREHAPLPFPLFALVCASGWVWVPSMVIFSEETSAAGSFVAIIGALSLAYGLRSATGFSLVPAQSRISIAQQRHAELFEESLSSPPAEPHGYMIAIGLYAACAALLTRSNYTAAAFFALTASLFAWKTTSPRSQPDSNHEYHHEYNRPAQRLALMAIPAVLITLWALLDGVAYRVQSAANSTAVLRDEGSNRKTVPQTSAHGAGGYQSVVLWPLPKAKQIVAPFPEQTSLLAPGTSRPLIIHFDGPYWYLQPPETRPGPQAHQARGTPLDVNIEANNSLPLVMEAHQKLGTAIRVAHCREIQVEIVDRDDKPGALAMAVLLTNTELPKTPALYLGQQPVTRSTPIQPSTRLSPNDETLRFSVPADAKLREFDEITVMLLPDLEHSWAGPKIAIEQFQLLPR